jgi:carnitine 3-dehydrogenase
MPLNQPLHRIAIVGTGVIGEGWAAYSLARGFEVVATDPGPQAEADLRRYVDDACPLLTQVGISAGASPDRLTFT